MDIMVDIETLGTTPGSSIISIGAVLFDPELGTLGDEFYVNIDPASCAAWGLTVDPKTVAWWADQSQEAKDALLEDQRTLEGALTRLSAFFGWTDHKMWARSPSFDEVLLAEAYKKVGMPTPWSYKSPRDVRTICDLAGYEPGQRGVRHNALDDARSQALDVIECYKRLGLAKQVTSLEEDWRWYYSITDGECCYGECGTREEAIELGREEYGDGETFSVMRAKRGSVLQYFPSGNRIMEMIAELADDEGAMGEDYYVFNGDTTVAEKDLERAMVAWFQRHADTFPVPWAFSAVKDREEIPGEPASECSRCGDEHPSGTLEDGLCPPCCDADEPEVVA